MLFGELRSGVNFRLHLIFPNESPFTIMMIDIKVTFSSYHIEILLQYNSIKLSMFVALYSSMILLQYGQ